MLDEPALTPDDATACADLARSCGWAHEPDKWRVLLACGQGFGAADDDGRLVGVVVLTRCTPTVMAIGSMLVAPDAQRRGLGTALMRRALAAAGDCLVTLFATREGLPLYRRLGFRETGALTSYRAEEVAPGLPDPRSRPLLRRDLAAVLDLDAVAHGGRRDALLAAWLGFGRGARVVVEEDRLLGFAAAWPSERSWVIGPLIAVDEDTAVHLLADVLSDPLLRRPGPVRVDVIGDRPRLVAWLADHGFARRHGTAQMALGAAGPPGRPEMIFAPVTQALT